MKRAQVYRWKLRPRQPHQCHSTGSRKVPRSTCAGVNGLYTLICAVLSEREVAGFDARLNNDFPHRRGLVRRPSLPVWPPSPLAVMSEIFRSQYSVADIVLELLGRQLFTHRPLRRVPSGRGQLRMLILRAHCDFVPSASTRELQWLLGHRASRMASLHHATFSPGRGWGQAEPQGLSLKALRNEFLLCSGRAVAQLPSLLQSSWASTVSPCYTLTDRFTRASVFHLISPNRSVSRLAGDGPPLPHGLTNPCRPWRFQTRPTGRGDGRRFLKVRKNWIASPVPGSPVAI